MHCLCPYSFGSSLLFDHSFVFSLQCIRRVRLLTQYFIDRCETAAHATMVKTADVHNGLSAGVTGEDSNQNGYGTTSFAIEKASLLNSKEGDSVTSG